MTGGLHLHKNSPSFLEFDHYMTSFMSCIPFTSKVVARTRRLCHTGLFQNSSGHVLRGRNASDIAIPVSEDCSYATLGMTRPLSDSKAKHL